MAILRDLKDDLALVREIVHDAGGAKELIRDVLGFLCFLVFCGLILLNMIIIGWLL